MPRYNLAVLIVAIVLVLLGLVASLTAPPPQKDYLLLKQVAEVLAYLDRYYVRPLSDEERAELIENMIDGGIRRLDDHSEYMNIDRAQQFSSDTEGHFTGIGVTISADPESQYLKIESLIPGTPAYEAGLAAGDLIIRINDQSTFGFKPEDGRKAIVGPAGTPVTIVTRRNGREPTDLAITIVRGNIEVNPVSGVSRRADDPKRWNFMLDDPAVRFGYIRLAGFSAKATEELLAAFKTLQEQGAQGVILDLRENPGGLLPQAISVADLFLPAGRIVSTRNRQGDEQTYDATPAQEGWEFLETIPLAVLVNRQSASASEIVAAALQDHQRAVIVGERTFGKGSVQKVFNLPGPPRASLKITTETYWRPSGKNIHRDLRKSKDNDDWGVKPDIDVPLTDDERLRWVQHLRAREQVTGKPGVTPPQAKPRPSPPEEKPFVDRVLNQAIEAVKKKLPTAGPPGRPHRQALVDAVRA